MGLTSIGDLSSHFVAQRHNFMLKSRLATLSQELSTGQVVDVTRHLGGDGSRLLAVDHGLTLVEGFERTAGETADMLAMMQIALGRVEDHRQSMTDNLLPVTASSSVEQIDEAARSGREGFADVVHALNARFASRSLFAGAATDRAALDDPEVMLADLSVAVSGATDAATVEAAVDAWFSDPLGGFAAIGYLGSTGPNMVRRVDPGQDIDISVRADAIELRAVLKGAALAAMAGPDGPTLPKEERATLIRNAGEALLSAGQGLAEVQARIGYDEARIEEVRASHSAQKAAWELVRQEMVAADPYETATALQEVELQLETHYTLTARLSRLRLTEFLR